MAVFNAQDRKKAVEEGILVKRYKEALGKGFLEQVHPKSPLAKKLLDAFQGFKERRGYGFSQPLPCYTGLFFVAWDDTYGKPTAFTVPDHKERLKYHLYQISTTFLATLGTAYYLT